MHKSRILKLCLSRDVVRALAAPSVVRQGPTDTVETMHAGLTNCLFGCSGASCSCPPR